MIKDMRMLLASEHNADENINDADFFQTSYKTYEDVIETSKQQKIRRNRLLDHLLARFNELFVDYSVFKFQQNAQGDFFDQVATGELINDKIQFLKVYPVISSRRSHTFNYTKSIYYTDNIAGLQLRIQKMLGVDSSQNKSLVTPVNNVDYKTLIEKIVLGDPPQDADKLIVQDNRFDSFDKNFGIHVLEHILLRPLYQQSTDPLSQLLPLCGDGSDNKQADCLLPDYYSMQMTVVAPGWLSISNNMDFRSFTESLIRAEAPAHVALKICWLDPAIMFLFEKTTEIFFDQMAKIKATGAQPTAQDIIDFNTALNDVNTVMGLLKNMYLPSALNECENINYNADEDIMKVPVILNYSALGSDGTNEWFVFNKAQQENLQPAPQPEVEPVIISGEQPSTNEEIKTKRNKTKSDNRIETKAAEIIKPKSETKKPVTKRVEPVTKETNETTGQPIVKKAEDQKEKIKKPKKNNNQ